MLFCQTVQTVEDALDNQFTPSEMDMNWDTLTDQNDGEVPNLTTQRQMVITDAPEMLTIMLQRNNPFTGEKDNGRVSFEEELDLSSHLSEEAKVS